MFSWNRQAAAVAAAMLLVLPGLSALGQAPAAAPQTFWNWMGIPSEPFAGLRNREGNFPQFERKPPLKKIADPANLASDNAAIKKAAEIKAQEDLAAQKIKAIKYLAEIGCGGCYEGVDKALAEALDDCTEAVRYEAVQAIIAASVCGENQCVRKCVRQIKTCKESMCDCWVGCLKRTCATLHLLCGKPGPDGVTLKSKLPGYGCGAGGNCPGSRCACGDGNCCTSEILNKLSTMAFEKDDRGCWKEPSPRVRAMARQALRACGPNIRPRTDADIPAAEQVPLPQEEKKGEDAPVTAPRKGEQAPGEQSAETASADPAGDAERNEPQAADANRNVEDGGEVSDVGLAIGGPASPVASEPNAAVTVPAVEIDAGVVADRDAVVAINADMLETVAGDGSQPQANGPAAQIVMIAAAVPVAPSPEDLFPQPRAAAPVDLRVHHVLPPAPARAPSRGIFRMGW